MNRTSSAQKFMVFTPDTMTIEHIDAEMIREVQRSAEISKRMQEVEMRNLAMAEELLRRFADRQPHSEGLPSVAPQPFGVWKDANEVGIQIGRDVFGPNTERRHSVVVPMPRRLRTYSFSSPTAHIEIGIYGDSITPGEIVMDSAMTRFFNHSNLPEYNLRMMDSIFSTINSQFRMHPEALSFDSVFRTLEGARRKAFEEQRQHQQQLQRDVRYKKPPVAHEQ
jgi:hypothetical protein